MKNKIKIGLFGYGVVGESLHFVLKHRKTVDAGISKICLRQKDKKCYVTEGQFVYNKEVIINDRKINLEIIPMSILFNCIINRSNFFTKKMQLI